MTLHVAGGTYLEECVEGEWRQLYGSALRAAAALQNISDIHLHTAVAIDHVPWFESVCATFNIQHMIENGSNTVAFVYQHGLSEPKIIPSLEAIAPAPQLKVTADRVLRFGMVDGDVKVDGRRVVYDPQSAYNPVPFSANGSVAERLVIVCNRHELALLTREGDLATGATKLREMEGAEAVVVKCGSRGAVVVKDNGVDTVPAFETEHVWPIGSGDVFAAAFFAAWAHLDYAPREAALVGSRAAAHYCATRSLPLPNLGDGLSTFPPLNVHNSSGSGPSPTVYLAGPFFNIGQRWLVNEARRALLEQGLQVFSPFHDVGIGTAEEVVDLDLDALRRSTVVLALLDGYDSGTIFEVGYARSIGKPVVGLCYSCGDEALKMMVGTDCRIVDDFVSAIYHTAWAALKT